MRDKYCGKTIHVKDLEYIDFKIFFRSKTSKLKNNKDLPKGYYASLTPVELTEISEKKEPNSGILILLKRSDLVTHKNYLESMHMLKNDLIRFVKKLERRKYSKDNLNKIFLEIKKEINDEIEYYTKK